jgi:hypothetical protein
MLNFDAMRKALGAADRLKALQGDMPARSYPTPPPVPRIPAGGGYAPTPMPELPPAPAPIAQELGPIGGAAGAPMTARQAILRGIGEGLQRGIFDPYYGTGRGRGGRGGGNPALDAYEQRLAALEVAEAEAATDKLRGEDWRTRSLVPFEGQEIQSSARKNDMAGRVDWADSEMTLEELRRLRAGLPTPDKRYEVDAGRPLVEAQARKEDAYAGYHNANRLKLEALTPEEVAFKRAQTGAQEALEAQRRREPTAAGGRGGGRDFGAESALESLDDEIWALESQAATTDRAANEKRDISLWQLRNQRDQLRRRLAGSGIGVEGEPATDPVTVPLSATRLNRLEQAPAAKPEAFGEPSLKDYPEALELARAAGIDEAEVETEARELIKEIVAKVGNRPDAVRGEIRKMLTPAGGM